MNRIKSLVSIFAFSLLVMSLPMVASAQWGGNNRDRNRDDNYGRNNGYYNTAQLKSTIKRLKNDSKDMAKFIDRELDRSRYDDRRREESVNRLAENFKKAADRLEDKFDERNIYRSQREYQDVMNTANQLERALRQTRLGYDINNYWNNIKNQLNEISYAYNGRNNRNNNRGGGWGNRFPF